MSHRISFRSLVTALGGLIAGGGLLASYAASVEPHWAETVRIALRLPRLPSRLDGLTLAQISDLHAGHHMSEDRIRRSVSMVNALRPDVIAITGDMFHRHPREAQMCADELGALYAPLGVYAIMGNHERRLPPDEGEMPFRRAGLTVLANAAHEVTVDGASLWMVGYGIFWL